MKLTVWTRAYRPFLMGGNVHTPVATELEVDDPVDLGNGIQGHLLTSPGGTTIVAEASTGAFVGPDIETVKKNIADANEEVITRQLDAAKKLFETADHVTEEEFWQLYDKNKDDD